MLPDKSQASITNGIWFVHNDELNSIKIFGSYFGTEKIYLNEKLVSERRSVKMKSEHRFTDETGNVYKVTFNVISMVKGIMDCHISRNEVIVKSFHTSFKKGKNFTVARFASLIVLAVAFGLISNTLGLPESVFYIFLILVLILIFLTRDHGEIAIEER